MLVDLPGYGYARISREISAEWPKFIDPYLKERKPLQFCVVLVDANVPAQASDRQLIEFLRHAGRDFLVVATKTDKLSVNKLRSALAGLEREHQVNEILPYSARTGAGRNELWRAIHSRVER
jgi:GTP-binding protein